MYQFFKYKTWKKNRKRTANDRLCKLCRLNNIENEYHFLCVCPVYNSRRKILFEEVELKHVHFQTLSLSDKFIFVMKHFQNRSIKAYKRGMVYYFLCCFLPVSFLNRH